MREIQVTAKYPKGFKPSYEEQNRFVDMVSTGIAMVATCDDMDIQFDKILGIIRSVSLLDDGINIWFVYVDVSSNPLHTLYTAMGTSLFQMMEFRPVIVGDRIIYINARLDSLQLSSGE